MKKDPWFKTALKHTALGNTLELRIPHDVFSTQYIDEGTLLLLNHLPPFEPHTVLDMGCGYGALGLPIAAKFTNACVEMIDRDLLAVGYTAQNAHTHGLDNVIAYGSLGYRDLRNPPACFDWILCNIPARIGRPFIYHFLESGRSRLTPQGQIRIVVIYDLVPLIDEIRDKTHWPIIEEARGPRHVVFSLEAGGTIPVEPPSLYVRDTITIDGLTLERPFDLGGDDPKRLSTGLPVLLDVLPRQAPGRVFSFRCLYGALPLIARQRWPSAHVFAVDRDLLATTFTRRNAAAHDLGGEFLTVSETAHFPELLSAQSAAQMQPFDFAMGELSPSAGKEVACAEIESLIQSLAPGGSAMTLVLDKLEREWLRPFSRQRHLQVSPVISREGYSVLRWGALSG